MFAVNNQRLDLPPPFDRLYLILDCGLIVLDVLVECKNIMQELGREISEEIYRDELIARSMEMMNLFARLNDRGTELNVIETELQPLIPALNLIRNNTPHQVSAQDRNRLHVLKLRLEGLERVSRILGFQADALLDRLKNLQTMIRNQIPWHLGLESRSSE